MRAYLVRLCFYSVVLFFFFFFFFKQKTAYEMRISDWSSDVCSSDLAQPVRTLDRVEHVPCPVIGAHVAKAGGDPALRRHGVAAGRKDLGDVGGQIGRASCRERVCQYV